MQTFMVAQAGVDDMHRDHPFYSILCLGVGGHRLAGAKQACQHNIG